MSSPSIRRDPHIASPEEYEQDGRIDSWLPTTSVKDTPGGRSIEEGDSDGDIKRKYARS